jgi:signal transduction histidine kinase
MAEAVVAEIVRRTAYRWESFLSGARAVFCFAVLVRLVAANVGVPGGLARLTLEVPVLLAVIAFSVWIVVRARRGIGGDGLLVASVCVDAVGCVAALATNVLTPAPTYEGILRMPDIAAILIVAMAAGLRLAPRATFYAALLNILGATALIGLDLVRNQAAVTYAARDVVFFGILLVAALVLAVLVSTRARILAREHGVETVAADRAQRNMWEVLQDSHEMRSALSAVALETDLFLRAADKGEDVDRVGKSLRDELASLNALVAGVRERTYAELAALQGAAPVAVTPVADEIVERVAARFSSIAIERTGEDVSVLLAGGKTSLERIFSNLVVNACEGNGTVQPKHVRIEIHRRERAVVITVADDGPGFSDAALASSLEKRGTTTKKDGSGLGLFFVHSIVAASGGTLVTVSLPAAE